MLDECTEILINRRLDGELSPAESLELDKLLIRNPQARTLLDEYTRMDDVAGEVIRNTVAEPARNIEPAECSSWTHSPLRWWRSFGLISAVAACITLAFLFSQRAMVNSAPSAGSFASADRSTSPDAVASGNTDYVASLQGRRRETESVQRDVIGVWDQQSNSLYLLELNSARSLVEPVRANY